MTRKCSSGKILHARLRDSLRIIERGLVPAGRSRAIITGVTHVGKLVDGMTLDQFIAQGVKILVQSALVYCFESGLVMEFNPAGEPQLLPLAHQARAEAGAPSLLVNLLGVVVRNEDSGVESLMPD